MLLALLVTLACIPLLVLGVFDRSSSSGAVEVPGGSDPSLVVATFVPVAESVVDPSSIEADSPTSTVLEAAAVSIVAPAAATPTTVARAPQATTTTTIRVVATAPPISQSDAAFLACVRARESRGDYGAVDPSGTYRGAYQIYQGGWDSIAAAIGRTDLVGVLPNLASPVDQDTIAAAMLARSGRAPWGGVCS